MNLEYSFSELILTKKIYLSKKKNEEINFSRLLIELTKRALNENKFERNLFFH